MGSVLLTAVAGAAALWCRVLAAGRSVQFGSRRKAARKTSRNSLELEACYSRAVLLLSFVLGRKRRSIYVVRVQASHPAPTNYVPNHIGGIASPFTPPGCG
mgnify:CR=1 FL=1